MVSVSVPSVDLHGSIPGTLRTATIAVLLFILVLMTGDIVIWAHGGMHWTYLLTVLGSEMLVVGVWLALEMRSKRYAYPSIERPTRWFRHHFRRLPLLFLGFLVCTYALRYFAAALRGADYGLGSAGFATALLVVELCKVGLLYFCWLGLVFGFQTLKEVRERNERLLKLQRSLAEAQLAQLRSQLRPHFLFNALNTVSATMQDDVARADRLLTLFADLLRANLSTTQRDDVTLGEELELLRRYIDIMQARFGDRVKIDIQIDASMDATIPPMLLQPLIENAYKHGVERNAEPQTITLSIRLLDGKLAVTIRNTGSTLAQPYEEGFGTRSCRERLALLYGGEATFVLRNQPDGVEAMLLIPQRQAA